MKLEIQSKLVIRADKKVLEDLQTSFRGLFRGRTGAIVTVGKSYSMTLTAVNIEQRHQLEGFLLLSEGLSENEKT